MSGGSLPTKWRSNSSTERRRSSLVCLRFRQQHQPSEGDCASECRDLADLRHRSIRSSFDPRKSKTLTTPRWGEKNRSHQSTTDPRMRISDSKLRAFELGVRSSDPTFLRSCVRHVVCFTRTSLREYSDQGVLAHTTHHQTGTGRRKDDNVMLMSRIICRGDGGMQICCCRN